MLMRGLAPMVTIGVLFGCGRRELPARLMAEMQLAPNLDQGFLDDLGALAGFGPPAWILASQLAGLSRERLIKGVGTSYEIGSDSCRPAEEAAGDLARVQVVRLDDILAGDAREAGHYRDFALDQCKDWSDALRKAEPSRKQVRSRSVTITLRPKDQKEGFVTLHFKADVDELRRVVRFQCLSVTDE